MAENVMLFLRHHFKKLCFITLVVLVIIVALQFGCKVFVAVAGFEPATSPFYGLKLIFYVVSAPPPSALYQLSYTAHRIYLSLIQAAGSHTSLRHTTQSPSALLDLQSGFRISIRSVCCDCVATIRPSILTTSLGLALLPIRMLRHSRNQMHQPVMLSDSEITSFLPVVLTGWIPSLSTPSALRSLSMPFQLMVLHDPLRDYSPPLLPLCIQYIQPTCRDCHYTSLGVCGR